MKNAITKKVLGALVSFFLLSACGDGASQPTSYDGRVFDISLAQDGSLICTSKKEGNYYTLTISGEGEGKDYETKNLVPWNPIAKKVTEVTIEEGITYIGDHYFFSTPLSRYILPSTVEGVGDNAFNSSATIFTYGSELDNIDNDVYLYSETKPTGAGKYFYMQDGEPQIWVVTPVSFLFIGNSFTYRGTNISDTSNPEVPLDFKKIASNLNIDVNIDSVCKGSHTLTKFADKTDEMGSIVEEKLTKNQYDYVILQEQSTTPINNYNNFLTAVKKLKARIDATQTKCKTVLYETWGSPTAIEGTSYKNVGEMEAVLREAYKNAGEESGCSVNYIGKAFTVAYMEENINIYADDNRHQNGLGAYLSAACHLRSIFKVNVSGCTEYCDLPQNECKALLSVTDKTI